MLKLQKPKKTIMRIIFGITLLLCLLSNAVFAQWEMYRNLDFRQSAEDSLSKMAYWRAPEFAAITPDFRNKKGKRNPCIKIFGDYSKDRPGYVYQQYPISVKEYVNLRISAKIKGENITQGKGYIYCYTKKGDQWLQYKALEEEAILGTAEWKKVSLEIWVGPDADILRIGASLGASGSLWVDDFTIQELESKDCTIEKPHLAFMKECMDIIGEYSLYKDDIDTAQLMKNWKRLSSCSKSLEGVQEGLKFILSSIDKHSFFMPASKVNKWQSTSSDSKANTLYSKGYHLDEHYAYLWMPHFSSGDSIANILFANHLQQLIDSLDHPSIKGWVLDLRDNQGGNCWPMLAGIGPLLGEGVCGHFKKEEHYDKWIYRAGGSYYNEDIITQVNIPPYLPYLQNPPMAVLIGPRTSSSGEVVAVAFKNRPKTRLFGLPTSGYSTGNTNHLLSDGSMLFLAQSVYTDREKNAYRDGLSPDIEIENQEETEKDATLDQALLWLKENGLDR